MATCWGQVVEDEPVVARTAGQRVVPSRSGCRATVIAVERVVVTAAINEVTEIDLVDPCWISRMVSRPSRPSGAVHLVGAERDASRRSRRLAVKHVNPRLALGRSALRAQMRLHNEAVAALDQRVPQLASKKRWSVVVLQSKRMLAEVASWLSVVRNQVAQDTKTSRTAWLRILKFVVWSAPLPAWLQAWLHEPVRPSACYPKLMLWRSTRELPSWPIRFFTSRSPRAAYLFLVPTIPSLRLVRARWMWRRMAS